MAHPEALLRDLSDNPDAAGVESKAKTKARARQRRALASSSAAQTCCREFESLRTAWSSLSLTSQGMGGNGSQTMQRPISFVAIDFEFWEQAHGAEKEQPIEIGWAVAEMWPGKWPQDLTPSTLDGWWFRGAHFCPTSEMSRKNGRYVPDNRHRFLFSESHPPFTRHHPDGAHTSIGGEVGDIIYPTGTKQASQQAIVEAFTSMVARLRENGPVVFVFHDATSDIHGLEHLGIDASKWMKVPITTPLPHGPDSLFYVDTRDYSALLLRLGTLQRGCSLKKLANMLSVNGGSVEALHNAGNDAMYTLLCLVTMLADGPLQDLGDRLLASKTLIETADGTELKLPESDSLPGGRGKGRRARSRRYGGQ